MRSRWTIPAAVLDALGGLTKDDPPVLVQYAHSGRMAGPVPHPWPWHPAEGNTLDGDAPILLPPSAPAVAAVLARAVGLNGMWAPTTWGMHPLYRCYQLTGPRTRADGSASQSAASFIARSDEHRAEPADDARRGCFFVPGLSAAECGNHALALVACWVAEERAGVEHGTWAPEEVPDA